jgi:hypothetical protein
MIAHRLTRITLLSIFVGSITTFLSSGYFAWRTYGPIVPVHSEIPDDVLVRWQSVDIQGWPSSPSSYATRETFGCTQYGIGILAGLDSTTLVYVESGYPFRCFRGYVAMPDYSGKVYSNGILSFNAEMGYRRFIPLRPMGAALFANVLTHAIVPFLAMTAALFATRTYRRRCHQCLDCGYNVRGVTRCPECGKKRLP